jgi:hypothetical protein
MHYKTPISQNFVVRKKRKTSISELMARFENGATHHSDRLLAASPIYLDETKTQALF